MGERPDRKPLRLRDHNYRAPCCVHVTICTHHRQALFGSVTQDGMRLNTAGAFVDAAIGLLHSDADGIGIDTHLVMPDHIHAIIVLGTNPRVQTTASIPDLVMRLKMRILRAWPGGVRHHGWPPYDGHLWQRSFYDTVIEHDVHLDATREYILANPGRWWERMRAD